MELTEILWDSGASISVMNEKALRSMGTPEILQSSVMLSGVFSQKNERCLGKINITIHWNGKDIKTDITIVRKITPDFIGGIEMMRAFRLGIREISVIDSDDISLKLSDTERLQKIMSCLKQNTVSEIGN